MQLTSPTPSQDLHGEQSISAQRATEHIITSRDKVVQSLLLVNVGKVIRKKLTKYQTAKMSDDFQIHQQYPTQEKYQERKSKPRLYTDVNGKEWFLFCDQKNTLVYDIINDKYVTMIDDYDKFFENSKLFNPRKNIGIYQDFLIDNSKHLVYWFDGEKSIGVFNIQNIPNGNIQLIDELPINANNECEDFEHGDGCQMYLVGRKIHFLFGGSVFDKQRESASKHYVFDVNKKELKLIHNDFEKGFFDKITFVNQLNQHNLVNDVGDDNDAHADDGDDDKNLKAKTVFVEELKKSYIKIDCRDKDGIYYPASGSANNGYSVKSEYRVLMHDSEDRRPASSVNLNAKLFCDCMKKCSNKSHKFSLHLTQSVFYATRRGKCVIYSKKHSKLFLLSRRKGLSCYKYLNYQHDDYNYNNNNNNDCNYNYNDEKQIEKHYFELIVFGYLRNWHQDIPKDLFGLILKYYFRPSDDEWQLLHNMDEKVPIILYVDPILANDENDIIMFQNFFNSSKQTVHRYNIDKDEFSEIEIASNRRGMRYLGIDYSTKTDRVYMWDDKHFVTSIKLSNIFDFDK